jgi:hypothetical protein
LSVLCSNTKSTAKPRMASSLALLFIFACTFARPE